MVETIRALELARFDAGKMGKVTLAAGEEMMVGLNCFLPGQQHARHSHDGQDKLYVVLTGCGAFQIGDDEVLMNAGELALIPGGVPHGARNSGTEELVVLVVMAPPPGKTRS